MEAPLLAPSSSSSSHSSPPPSYSSRSSPPSTGAAPAPEGGCCASSKRPLNAFASLDFDDYSSPVTEAHSKSLSAGYHQRTSCIRWSLTFCLGISVAVVAVLIIYCSEQLALKRYEAVASIIAEGPDSSDEAKVAATFSTLWAIGMGYAIVAAIPTIWIEPAAASSGIPEIKMVLNGVQMPLVTLARTTICRIWGVIFAVASGLPGEQSSGQRSGGPGYFWQKRGGAIFADRCNCAAETMWIDRIRAQAQRRGGQQVTHDVVKQIENALLFEIVSRRN